MTFSTTTAMRRSMEATIKALAPVGDRRNRRTYRLASTALSSVDWSNKAQSDIDREFSITLIKREGILTIGAVSAVNYKGTFSFLIGHMMGGDLKKSEERRDTDVHQIASNLEHAPNYPTGVWIIRSTGWDPTDIEKHWLTTISFDIQYSLASP